MKLPSPPKRWFLQGETTFFTNFQHKKKRAQKVGPESPYPTLFANDIEEEGSLKSTFQTMVDSTCARLFRLHKTHGKSGQTTYNPTFSQTTRALRGI